MKYAPIVSLLCMSCIVLSGCSSNLTQPDEYSGFLKDYSVLKEDKSASGAPVMRWIDPDVKASRYTSFYVEPSQLYPKPQPTEKIPQSTLSGITSYYDQALKRELGKTLPMADSPGPGTLIVRPAITAVSSSTQGLKPYEVIPIALVAAAVSTASGIRDQDTTIATEIAFLDADSNRVVAELVRKGTGVPLENDSQVMKAADVKKVLDGWASDINLSIGKLRTSGK